MPQLDALTYFSQYIYLVITFVGVYSFVLRFIMPSVVSTFKLRQKLNSLHLLSSKLSAPSKHVYKNSKLQKLFTQYHKLQLNLWKLESNKQSSVYVTSARTMQLCTTLALKKMGCAYVIRTLR